jgi:hypothetical protein
MLPEKVIVLGYIFIVEIGNAKIKEDVEQE